MLLIIESFEIKPDFTCCQSECIFRQHCTFCVLDEIQAKVFGIAFAESEEFFTLSDRLLNRLENRAAFTLSITICSASTLVITCFAATHLDG